MSPASTPTTHMPQSNQPWVFTKCGHVHGFDVQLMEKGQCSMCRETGNYTNLKIEDDSVLRLFCFGEMPGFVFNPCGHVVDKKSAELWSSLKQPALQVGSNDSQSISSFFLIFKKK